MEPQLVIASFPFLLFGTLLLAAIVGLLFGFMLSLTVKGPSHG